MIIIDANQLISSALTVDTTGLKLDETLVRFATLRSIRLIRSKYHREYGELVFAFDSSNSWRKDYFPFYKAKRKKEREDSRFDWDKIHQLMDLMRVELIEFFPYHVIKVDRCEGDDIIAVLTRYVYENKKDNSTYDLPEPTLIVSSDKDFLQLHNNYIKQLSIRTKKPMLLEKAVEYTLFEHIVKGDTADGVPNVLSADNSFVDSIRQVSVYGKKIEEWFKEFPKDEQFQKNFQRNKQLIDLSCIPEEYKQNILNTYLNYKVNDRSKMMTYFMTRRLINLIDDIQDY